MTCSLAHVLSCVPYGRLALLQWHTHTLTGLSWVSCRRPAARCWWGTSRARKVKKPPPQHPARCSREVGWLRQSKEAQGGSHPTRNPSTGWFKVPPPVPLSPPVPFCTSTRVSAGMKPPPALGTPRVVRECALCMCSPQHGWGGGLQRWWPSPAALAPRLPSSGARPPSLLPPSTPSCPRARPPAAAATLCEGGVGRHAWPVARGEGGGSN